MPAISMRVIGLPIRSDMTGIGAVSTSMIGWNGLREFLYLDTIGPT
jgi:hypothetical protein